MTASRICRNCNQPNTPIARYCKYCTQLLPITLPSPSASGKGMLSPNAFLAERCMIRSKVGKRGLRTIDWTKDRCICGKIWAGKEMGNAATNDSSEKLEVRRAFEHESGLLSTLPHPGIPQVTDCFYGGAL